MWDGPTQLALCMPKFGTDKNEPDRPLYHPYNRLKYLSLCTTSPLLLPLTRSKSCSRNLFEKESYILWKTCYRNIVTRGISYFWKTCSKKLILKGIIYILENPFQKFCSGKVHFEINFVLWKFYSKTPILKILKTLFKKDL